MTFEEFLGLPYKTHTYVDTRADDSWVEPDTQDFETGVGYALGRETALVLFQKCQELGIEPVELDGGTSFRTFSEYRTPALMVWQERNITCLDKNGRRHLLLERK